MDTVRLCYRVFRDAFYRFNSDDGWAIASHIALSVLMAMFPFLIVVTGIAGFIGSNNLANEVASLIVAAWPPEVADPIANEIQRVLTGAHGGVRRTANAGDIPVILANLKGKVERETSAKLLPRPFDRSFL